MRQKILMLICLLLTACHESPFYFDSQTQLHWQHCPAGQQLIFNHCRRTAKTLQWDEALRYCASLDNNQSWRLPNRTELLAYYSHYGTQKMAIINLYWSSSTEPNNPQLAWYLIPQLNWLYANLKELDGLVLCVKSP